MRSVAKGLYHAIGGLRGASAGALKESPTWKAFIRGAVPTCFGEAGVPFITRAAVTGCYSLHPFLPFCAVGQFYRFWSG